MGQLFACWVISHALIKSADIFFKKSSRNMPTRNTNKVSNGLDPDQGLCSVGSDLDQNCW